MKPFRKPLPKGTATVVALARHPLHPMLVTFPIAFFIGALPADLAFWYTGDAFWARVAVWLLGAGSLMGLLAAVTGTIELLSVAGIRRRPASWNHFVVAVMLLSVQFINWLLRISQPEEAVIPLGMYLSGLGALLVAAAGWMGGHLVFEHQIAVGEEDEAPAGSHHEFNLADESDR